jgi:hypothetical protein
MSTCIPRARLGAHLADLLGPAPRPPTLTPGRAGARLAARAGSTARTRTRATRPARVAVEHARAGAAKEPGLTRKARA